MSKHFSLEEFACKDGTPYPKEWAITRFVVLTDVLEAIRLAWGGPLITVCGYRTAGYNARIAKKSEGVAKFSRHVQGDAADIRPMSPTPEKVRHLHRLTLEMHKTGKIPNLGGLGLYPGWIHVDTRPHKPMVLAQWGGQGEGSEPIVVPT